MKGPIFVTGLRKSGTTLVKCLLDSHPEIFMFPAAEFEFFHNTEHDSVLAAKYELSGDIHHIRDRLCENSFITRLNDKTKQTNDYCETIDVENFKKELKAQELTGMGDLFSKTIEAMAKSCSYFKGNLDTTYMGAKCVLNSEYFSELHKWYPDLKMIYVLRNPYGHFDAIRSSMRKGVKAEGQKLSDRKNSYPILGIEIRRMMMSYYFMKKWSKLYPDNFHVIVYDQLLQNPQEEMQKVSKFLGVPYNSSMLVPTIGEQLWGGNSWKVEDFKGIDIRPLTHWKDTISDLEIRLVNEYFGDVLEEFGFDKVDSNAPLIKRNHPSERLKAYLANRFLFKAKSWFCEIPDAHFKG